MSNFLKVGDVIEIKKGMTVYAKIPQKYVHLNRPFSNELTKHNIKVGELYVLSTDKDAIIKKLNQRLISCFEYETGLKITEDIINDFVQNILKDYNNIESFDSSCFAGEYVVVETSLSGGGYAQGRDYYPDGHYVICRKIVDNKVTDEEISFYQSGSFTVMIAPDQISPIRKVNLTLTIS